MPSITALAKHRPCTVRGPSCNRDPATTVAAHFRSHRNGAGMGIRPADLFIAFACSACHDWVDGRVHIDGHDRDEARHAHLLGMIETQRWLMENGHVVIV